jgi:hypothetical protein
MSMNIITESDKKKCMKKAKKEFPDNKVLRDIHYIRYIMELEWKGKTPDEILMDIKIGAKKAIEEMKKAKKQKIT